MAAIKIVLYTPQPVLARGFETVAQGLDGFTFSAVHFMPALVERIQAERPDMLLLDVTAELGLAALRDLLALAPGTYILLWADAASADLASQAVAFGVRGILRKNLPVELQLKCLRKVAAGEFWLDQDLTNRLLAGRRTGPMPREQQLTVLLAQGLKNKEMGLPAWHHRRYREGVPFPDLPQDRSERASNWRCTPSRTFTPRRATAQWLPRRCAPPLPARPRSPGSR
jgi:DNA-binding NarL/FixJ family response regulator